MKMHEKSKEELEQLKADCSKCSGLCCIGLFFSKVDGFPENKMAGKPCTKLQKDYRCNIHGELKKLKMKGCIGYDCFGAGQHVTQYIYKGETWQTSQEQSKEIFEVFVKIFQFHQMRYFLEESMTIDPAKELRNDIKKLIDENKGICNSTPQTILDTDIESYRTIFLGADARDTNFSNADLREAAFLTQGQINSAKGNKNTKLPQHLEYPVTWE